MTSTLTPSTRHHLTIAPAPIPSSPDEHQLALPNGEVVGRGRTLFHARCWREGWDARMDLRSQRSGPRPHHDGYAHWRRGWERANAHERQREKRERRERSA
ncbi:hypothetical protein [Deinococcus budaensis]|uniref:Uncharacterized protein n=1 Tax=Deinococcus budaensis TaxID=1665626 RepID=A0A7W8GF27_9DEIO|nr:hypothetical protein [Deinococcus budaensis]MBB5234444.1 hypothetical protein [Deinococcus budaensis]